VEKEGIYLVLAEFEEDVHIFRVFEDMLELDDVDLMEGSVDFDFREQLKGEIEGPKVTFCLALLLESELFWIIFDAKTFLVSRFTNS
jgi:hypothetical protein